MNSTLISYDWKKAAAQVADDGTVERAFMDQAYGFLANKAGKLMQDPYRLGFEVVFKNDSNTRMVGIFAFRVNDQILYAPVFFLNGEIKGTDLLYRQETKTFVPNNTEWVSFLTEKNNYEPGSAIARKNFTNNNNGIRFEDIAYPPSQSKSKSAAELSPLFKIVDAFFAKEAGEDTKLTRADLELSDAPGQLMHKFITEDGGADAVAKIAAWMENSFEFAEALVTNIDEKDYMPSDIKVNSVKKAAVANKPSLVLFTGRPGKSEHYELLKTAADNEGTDKLTQKGYFMWDERSPADIEPIYRDNTEQLEMIGNCGLYDVMFRDGTFKKAIVAPRSRARFTFGSGDCCVPEPCVAGYSSYGGFDKGTPIITDHIICLQDGDKGTGIRQSIFGKFIKDQSQMIIDEEMEKTPKAGKAYCVFDAESGCLSDPVYVKSVKEKDGVHQYEFVEKYGGSRLASVRHNPDVTENDFATNFLGKDAYFVPVGTEYFKTEHSPSCTAFSSGPSTYYNFAAKEIDAPDIGTADTLDSWATEFFKKASVIYDGDTQTYSWRTGPKEQTHYMPRINMAVKLASQGFHAEAVEVMLDETAEQGRTNWFFGGPKLEELEKKAFPTRISQDAKFRKSIDRDFGVEKEEPQSYVLDTHTDEMDVPDQHIGDAYDPAMGRSPEDGLSKQQLMSMSPEQIAQFAASNKLPNVFEHGAVGAMVQVYDSMAMIDKYIPDLECGLDRLGRILFLFYWKPRDFEDAYGSDDMGNLENQIMSNFKSFGTLVLDLMKRSKKRKLGNVSLGS